MNEQDLKTISLRLAEAILLYKGEITIDEIKSLPFIDENDAQLIEQYLQKKFNLRMYSQKLRKEEKNKTLSIIMR